MRNNGPVTGREVQFPDNVVLVSRTSPTGIITFANQAFIDISGYTEDELIGAPHNLVRHPHMPQEAFADLWGTVKNGQPWQGAVKNRCKNGDHYWVYANVTPEIEKGQVKGYISIRTKLSRQQIADAEALYADMRAGKLGHMRLEGGRLIDGRVAARVKSKFQSIVWLLNFSFSISAIFLFALECIGLAHINSAVNSFESVYQECMVFSSELSRLVELSDENAINIASASAELEKGSDPVIRLNDIRAIKDSLNQGYARLAKAIKTDEQGKAFQKVVSARDAYVDDVIRPAGSAIERKDIDSLRNLITGPMPGDLKALQQALSELNERVIAVARAKYEHQKIYKEMLFVFAPAILLVSLIGLYFIRRTILISLHRPLERLAETFELIATNDIHAKARYLFEPVAEFWQISAQLKALQAKLSYSELAKKEVEDRAVLQRAEDMMLVASSFETQVGEVVSNVSSATVQLQAASKQLAANAEDTSVLASSVASASLQATQNVTIVASATEELSSSSNEIAGQMSQSQAVAAQAEGEVRETTLLMTQLADDVRSIGNIVDLINDVASQTNLLALNATIEAARAGEAGKGFAVVANEVKTLANQTARATDEITNKINTVQAGTQQAVAAIQSISSVISKMNSIGTLVAEAVQEQTAATGEIAHNVDQAAAGTMQVSQNIAVVEANARQTGNAASQISTSSSDLLRQTKILEEGVNRFLDNLRKGDTDGSGRDKKFRDFVRKKASEISGLFEQAVDRGDITLDGLFDESYQPIQGSNPEQFMTRFVELTDRILPPILESALDIDQRVVFCAAVDRNGYLPTHNRKFSEKQGNDPKWNDANCRNRRKFTDKTGLSAAQNRQPLFAQGYRRQMGDAVVMMVDCSAPIMVKGRHWGGLRLAYKA